MKVNNKMSIGLILLSICILYQINNYWNKYRNTNDIKEDFVHASSNMPNYSRLSSVREWDTFACRIDVVIYNKTQKHLWEYYSKDGKLFGGQWKTILVEHFFYESTGKNPVRKPFSLFQKTLWSQRKCFDIYTDYNLVEVTEVIEKRVIQPVKVLLDTHYRPDTYDKSGNHLCNIYGVNLECQVSVYGVHKKFDKLLVTSYAELWTPYNFQLGKNPLDKLSQDERRVIFGNN